MLFYNAERCISAAKGAWQFCGDAEVRAILIIYGAGVFGNMPYGINYKRLWAECRMFVVNAVRRVRHNDRQGPS